MHRTAGWVVGIAGTVGAVLVAIGAVVLARAPVTVPQVYANIAASSDGALVYQAEGGKPFALRERAPAWTLAQLRGNAAGTATGLVLDFKNPAFNGTLVYGLVPYHDTRFPQVVFRTSVAIKDGTAAIDIKGNLAGTYDMVGWQKSGSGVIGYRVITADGGMIYDGRVRFKGTGLFEIDVTMVGGPFVANVGPTRR